MYIGTFFIVFYTLVFTFISLEAKKRKLNEYVDHYETLNYDKVQIHAEHQRLKRSTSLNDHLKLHFTSHGRKFKARLKPDSSHFSSPSFLIDGRKTQDVDLSHLCTGYLKGEENTRIVGSIINGVFSGYISTPQEVFYVEKPWLYFKDHPLEHNKNSGSKNNSSKSNYFHSIIYSSRNMNPDPFRSEKDKMKSTLFEKPNGNDSAGCGLTREDNYEWMRKIQNSAINIRPKASVEHMKETRKERWKRNTNPGSLKNQCSLSLQTDHTLWLHYFEKNKRDKGRTKAELTSLLATHVAGLNEIYQASVFEYQGKGPYVNMNFLVHLVQINTTEACEPNSVETNAFCPTNLDASSFLNIHSLNNHEEFCLSYVFSYRRFTRGTVGLAWVGSPLSNGGVCEKWRQYRENSVTNYRSLNTGILTLSNYGSHVPLKVSIITIAHEVGHNFGAQHDSGVLCVPLLANPNDLRGNYLMYAAATSGDQPNNFVFSSCSIGNITENLHAIYHRINNKINCFTEKQGSVCGNSLVEFDSETNKLEECDCGHEKLCTDVCCNAKKCTLTPGSKCSISQGPCCNSNCEFTIDVSCREPTECSEEAKCTGSMAKCPEGTPKEDKLPCNHNTQVCSAGKCDKSICEKINWEKCSVANSTNREFLCHVSCRYSNTSQCISTADEASLNKQENAELKELVRSLSPNKKGILLRPGSACDGDKGYCDVFFICRHVDEEGPLQRLLNSLTDQKVLSEIRRWVERYPWAVALISLAFIVFFVLFIKLCSYHTPSSNPKVKQKEKKMNQQAYKNQAFVGDSEGGGGGGGGGGDGGGGN